MKMNLGMKIGAGFGSLIVIACLLGGLAIFNMQRVGTNATMLDEEYVPEVAIANEIERTTRLAMYEMRGYGYTEEEHFLKAGRENLAKVGTLLQEAQALAEKAVHLEILKEHVAEIRGEVNEYNKLTDTTVALNEKMAKNRIDMDNSAQTFMKSAEDYTSDQNQKLTGQINSKEITAKLLERADKITMGNQIIDLGNLTRIAAWRAQAERNPALINEAVKNFDEVAKKLGEIRPMTTSAEDHKRLNIIEEAGNTYKKNMLELAANWQQLQEVNNQRVTVGAKALEAAQETAKMGMNDTTEIAASAASALSAASVMMVIGLLIALALGVVIAIFMTRSITVPIGATVKMLNEMGKGRLENRLKMVRDDEIGQMAKTMDEFADTLQHQVVAALQKLAQGDLTSEVKPHDDQDVIGTSLLKTHEDLNRIVGEILAATEQIAAGSAQVSSSSQSLSQGATESAASLEQITSSMTEMASQTKLNAENSTQANQLAGEARKAAETGNDQMEKMMLAMGEINQAGQNISKIIKVIDEIAFQTNLLALNAAVEAARAGRHGKGFAVVAEEVRNLAARSAKAAKETAELIEGSVAKTENGTEIAAKTAESLQEIVTAITKATDLVGEIAAASNEQAQGISQVNEGLSQIDQVTQTNTANAEEGAAAAEELSSQADHMRGLMATFTIKGGSMRRQRALPSPAKSKGNGGGSNFRGWDSHGEEQAGRKPRPSEVIALDDREFGKY